MARRILPPELKRIGKCLFVRPHETRQLLFKSKDVSFIGPCIQSAHACAGGAMHRRSATYLDEEFPVF